MTAPTLTSKLDTESPEAKARASHNKALATDLREHVAKAGVNHLHTFTITYNSQH